MPLAAISDFLTYAEPVLWTLAFIVFLRSKNALDFKAFGVFLGIRAASTMVLTAILHAQLLSPNLDGHWLYTIYFYAYQSSYILGSIALFFTLQELFRHAMTPLPGLSRIAVRGFQWIALLSLIVASATIFTSLPAVSHDARCNYVFAHVADVLCIFELCLLAFLSLTAHTLGLSFRSRVFGISLGFGMMAAMEFVTNALDADLNTWPNQVLEIVTAMALVVWISYLLAPEPARQLTAQSIPARLLHWNDLATAIENTTREEATAVATGQGFLQNVEGVVDRVLAKNSVK